MAQALIASKDERIKYIISNRKIYSGTGQGQPPWVGRSYTGTNPHNHHVHVSVKRDATHYDDTRPWVLNIAPAAAHVDAPAAPELPILRQGASGVAVIQLQDLLNRNGALLKADGNLGPATRTAVKKFQGQHGLVADGVVGGYTWKALREKSE